MNSRTLKWIVLLTAVCLFVGAVCSAQVLKDTTTTSDFETGEPITVLVVVMGIEHTDGVMRLALFATADGFPGKMKNVYRRLEAPIEGDEVTFAINNVIRGRYAVAVFHDENGNDLMETDFIGRPKEGHGFSNDARRRFGPPEFKDASFDVIRDSTVIRIKLKY